ncbi:unnamed protein product [Adineta steineri]|uniref:Uncharacterized protein n=1 Tax=Adineta steineri TaxID=433720 RepID=A0A818LJB9_9BILA|nr:unnamed protein product [Adineta steineri]CAF3573611.1 unnamed protein product [Adineta steineri]
MDEIYPFIPLPKTPSVRSRPPSTDGSSRSMNRLGRDVIQHSLLYCLEKGYFCLIRYLLDSSICDARERDSEGRTGLIYCCFIDDDCWARNTAMTLLEKGAQIADQDQYGLNALHYAIITQRTILIRLYLDSIDFDLNQSADIHGNTCLHYACSTGNVNILRTILNAMKHYSIDLTIKNHAGLTAYDLACQLDCQRCQNLLRNEMTLQERANLRKPLIKPMRIDRRLSISDQIHSLTSPSPSDNSVVSVPFYVSSSTNLRKRHDSTYTLKNENYRYPSAKLINPIELRTMTFKRNEHLDALLVKHVKNRADLAPSIFSSASEVFNSSSIFTSPSDIFNSPSTSSWREDVPKIFDQLQILRSRSYKKTVHPPLSREISHDLIERMSRMSEFDRSRSQTISVQQMPTDGLQKVIRKQRTNLASVRAFSRTKKT